jgi:hypothetical protein
MAFVEDGSNFGEERVIFVNLTSMTLSFAKSDPSVHSLQNLLKMSIFVNLSFDLNDPDLCQI